MFKRVTLFCHCQFTLYLGTIADTLENRIDLHVWYIRETIVYILKHWTSDNITFV